MTGARGGLQSLLLLGLLYGITSLDEGRLERQKRFLIFPRNGIIQFALAIALPAYVPGRNIATNSGILINIQLPTNLSELRPPTRSVRSTQEHRGLTSQIGKLLGITEEDSGECYAELECYRRQFARSDYLEAEILEAILLSITSSEKSLQVNTSLSHMSCSRFSACQSPYAEFIKGMYNAL